MLFIPTYTQYSLPGIWLLTAEIIVMFLQHSIVNYVFISVWYLVGAGDRIKTGCRSSNVINQQFIFFKYNNNTTLSWWLFPYKFTLKLDMVLFWLYVVSCLFY